jgi:hypothetical protein
MVLASFNWSTRVWTFFLNAEIGTVEQLTEKTPREILKYRNVGTKALAEIRLRLGMAGLSLKGENVHQSNQRGSNCDDLLRRKMALEVELADVTQQIEEIEEARRLEKELKAPLDENAIYEEWKTGKTFTQLRNTFKTRLDIVSEICWSRLEADCRSGNPPQLPHRPERRLKCKSCGGLLVVRYENEPRRLKCPFCGRTCKYLFRA